MEEVIETGKDKVKKICDVLRKETLEPAMAEAKSIIDEAHAKAEKILEEASAKAKAEKEKAEREIEKRENVFQASLHQGARQSLEWLKQQIEDQLLNKHLDKMIAKASSTPEVLADLIKAFVKSIDEEGLDTELSAIIPQTIEPDAINGLLGKDLVEKLNEKSVIVGPFKGGVEMKLRGKKITIDLTDKALLELLTRFMRKDFHKYFFGQDSE